MVPVLNIESCSRTAAPQSFELTSFTFPCFTSPVRYWCQIEVSRPGRRSKTHQAFAVRLGRCDVSTPEVKCVVKFGQTRFLRALKRYACGGNRQRRTSNEVYANFTRSDRTLYFEIHGDDMVLCGSNAVHRTERSQRSRTAGLGYVAIKGATGASRNDGQFGPLPHRFQVPVKIHKILFFRTQQLSQTRASSDDPKT
ncbi:hypothetical protein BN1723_005014, partial [Verticillium longisporum]